VAYLARNYLERPTKRFIVTKIFFQQTGIVSKLKNIFPQFREKNNNRLSSYEIGLKSAFLEYFLSSVRFVNLLFPLLGSGNTKGEVSLYH
jgi:hypothetical protein